MFYNPKVIYVFVSSFSNLIFTVVYYVVYRKYNFKKNFWVYPGEIIFFGSHLLTLPVLWKLWNPKYQGASF